MERLLAVISIWLLLSCGPRHDGPENKIPEVAERALAHPSTVILYSLEPNAPHGQEPEVFGFRKLGEIKLNPQQARQAVGAFQAAVVGWDHKMAVCFNPRHALRLTSAGKTYYFVLCYQCHQMLIVGDGVKAVTVGAAGSPKGLNDLLIAANIPVSRSDKEASAGP